MAVRSSIALFAAATAAALLLYGLTAIDRGPAPMFGAIQNFGNTANNGSTQTSSVDRKYVYSATPSSSGTVVGGSARIWNGGTVNSNTNLVIYSDSAGAPNALLAVSDTLVVNTGTSEAARAYTFSGANQINVAGGTPYWIGVHFSDPGTGNISISRANIAGLVRSDPDTYSDGPTDPCACATSSNGGLDIYIQYDDAPSGGGSSTPYTDDAIIIE
jgi:hypothetical protein